MLNQIVSLVLSWGVPVMLGALWATLGVLFRSIRAMREGVCALLRSDIITVYEKGMQYGYCTVEEKEALSRTYHAYHILGGNDVATGLYHTVLAFPQKEEYDRMKQKK